MTSFEHARPAQNDTSTFKTKYHNITFLQYDHLFCLLVKYLKNINTHTTKLFNKESNKHWAKTNEQQPNGSKQGTRSNKQQEKVRSNEQRVTSNKQMVTSNEEKETSNEQKVTRS